MAPLDPGDEGLTPDAEGADEDQAEPRPLLGRGPTGLAVLGVAVLVALVILVVRGDYETFGPNRIVADPAFRAPAWTVPCRRTDVPVDYVERCARIRGTAVYVQRHDPDGDGDRHVLVLAGWHLINVKYPRGISVDLPPVGDTVRAVGHLPRGGGRLPPTRLEVRPGGVG